MSPAAERTLAFEPRPQPGRIRAFLLAAGVHGAFFALIVFGISWQVSPTTPLVAELWDQLPRTAPKPTPEPPPPAPEPPKPAPAKAEPAPPKPEKAAPPKPDPAIAEKAERLKREKIEREREERRKVEDARKQREQEEAARKKQEEEKRRREDERAKREAERARAEAAARRQVEIDQYVQKIKAKIRGVANVPDTVTGNPQIELRLRILPGGEVLEATVVKPSGNRAYDAAIERAIRSAQPLPVPEANSELFPQFRDLTLVIRHER